MSFEGHRCAFIRSLSEKTKGWSSVDQMFNAKPFRGKRIVYSGAIRTENVKGWAGMWMRIDSSDHVVGFDNMSQRPIRETSDWKRYSVILDVPKDATMIKIGFTLCGSGTVWASDLSVKDAAIDSATTGEEPSTLESMPLDEDKLEPAAKDFEFAVKDPTRNRQPNLKYWHSEADSHCYAFSVNPHSSFQNKPALTIALKPKTEPSVVEVVQEFNAKQYRGKRMQFSCAVKAENVNPGVGTYAAVANRHRTVAFSSTYSKANRLIKGSFGWRVCSHVIDVPDDAVDFRLGLCLKGSGVAHFAAPSLVAVNKTIPVTQVKLHVRDYADLGLKPHYLDFEHE